MFANIAGRIHWKCCLNGVANYCMQPKVLSTHWHGRESGKFHKISKKSGDGRFFN